MAQDAPSEVLRGFCHICAREVAPRELGDEEFECPLCGEGAMECPCEGFERWSGLWEVRYEGHEPYSLSVDDNGRYTAWRGGHQTQGQLRWAPSADSSTLMRLDGTGLCGGAECLGPGDEDELTAQLVAGGATVTGGARRDRPEDALRREIDAGVDELTEHWPGLAPDARDRLRAQLRQVAGAFAPMLSQQGLDGAGMGLADLGFNPFAPFDPLMMAPQDRRERQRAAVAEPLLGRWLAAKAFDGEGLEADWQCPICFDASKAELVLVCRDAGSHHAYHHECLQDWLVRRNECPTCRRTPIVTEGDTAE